MRNLERLEKLEAQVFSKSRATPRDYWRMVRNLPRFAKEVVAALRSLDQKTAALSLEQTVDGKAAVKFEAPPLSRITANSHDGAMLIIIPTGERKTISFDMANVRDAQISFGSDSTILTHRNDYASIVYLGEVAPVFQQTNRFFLESGRLSEFLVLGREVKRLR